MLEGLNSLRPAAPPLMQSISRRTGLVRWVEISCQSLFDYFPVAELNASQQSGYLLAIREGDGRCRPLSWRGWC